MNEYLFVYGTLQFPEVQEHVFGRIVPSTPDVLDNFARENITLGTETYFIVAADVGSSVEGCLLEITPAELARGDRYETSAYRRFRVTLRSGIEAWVYGR